MYLITPLFLGSIKLNLGLYLPTFFKIFFYLILYLLAFLLYLIPDIIIDHPVIFILMTISNIILLYIAYISTFDKNINSRENIIYLFNILKEYKFHPFKLLKIIIIHLKKWIYIKFKQLKDNWLYILLTLFIIIFIANVFRQPIFNYLGEDIFSNFYVYMYVMFSSILPTTYIIIILTKWLKTRNLDFSFRLVDFKDKITILYILFLFISLYISYYYIWPLIGFSLIYFIKSKITFINLILNFRNIPPILPSLSNPSLIILPGLTVTEVFGHFGSSFTKDEILPTIEHYEPKINDDNPSGTLTQYSHNKWISKLASTNNIKANAEYSRQNIKAPYLPTTLFKSYRNNFQIDFELNNYNTSSSNKDLPINIALYYFKTKNFYHYFGGPTGGGWIDKPLADLQTTCCRSKHCTIMTQSNKPLSEILRLIRFSAEQVIPGVNSNYASPFIIIYQEKCMTFAMFKHSETLEQNYPFKKGRTFQECSRSGTNHTYTDTPNFCGIIGLIATMWGVETIPPKNVYRPQLAFYDITNEKHAFAIHIIFKYMSLNVTSPELNDDFIQTNNDIDSTSLTKNLYGKDDLNIKLEQNGRLVREI